ncbi:hypothetical protein [Paenibacillus larvae]|nr:hypothetical protein [Paenibacillus larvae]MDT2191469.1 hypothetical protein [Paenibacillus larvae]MDT2242679.1 hypothetical protein [Paenibacillus larvae]MDT2257888.1 hypothetical protein [Paenibacillus larvae]MDT2260282.1 hypothetical protein [Paenibacillus larvae]MDT2291939.1 hypothetical protein [Paenibacillus larvae]
MLHPSLPSSYKRTMLLLFLLALCLAWAGESLRVQDLRKLS